MDEDEQEQRRKKVEAGRAKLAHFRQRKTKSDCTHSKKKTSKRKGSAVDAPVPEEGPVAAQDGRPLGARDLSRSTPCSRTTNGARGALATQEEEQDCELASRSEDEAAQQQQPQTAPSLELEALRLSLSNMHTVQLELTQANLQKEKECALAELREMLNGRRAQELALLQSRLQCELELVREQHAREKEAMALRCGQETAELKEKLRSEMERSVQMVETLKQDWESERELCLENLRKELSAKHQSEMEDLQNQFQKELAGQRAELEKVFQAKNQAEVSLKDLEAQHQAAIKQLCEDLQVERCQCLEDLESRFREREREKQLELENLQASYEALKAQSQEEVRRLWSQLESVRTNREELNGPLEPLLTRASCLEELEHLRQGFAQQQQRDRSQHESELQQLRVYFEKKLRDAEKTYQEDLTLFQQQLQEAKEEPPLGSGEVSSSCTFLEEMSYGKRKEHSDQLDLRLERQKMGPAWDSSLHVQHEDQLDRCLLGPEVLELEPLQAVPSDQHSQETEQVHHQCVQDVTLKEDMQVAARVLALEAEHKVRLSLLQTELKEQIELLKIENRNLQEKLQHETRLKEDLESVKRSLLEDHQEELNKAEQKVQLLKQEFRHKEVEWELLREDLRREAEENLASMCRELKEKAESEKQSAVSRFERREAGMRHLQDQQAAQILALEKSLAEQQGRLRQLEQALAGDQALPCHGCSQDPPVASDGQRGTLLEGKEECALQLMQARNRFLEERKEIMEKFAADQDAVLRDAQEKHAHELQLLQQGHQQQLLALRTELESRHQVELAELAATLQREQQVLLEARVAELQTKHAAEVSALERRHSSSLDALESCCTSGVQAIQDQHRQALQLLRAELEEQLQTQGSSHQAVLAQESETLKLKHEKELQSAKDSLRAEMRAEHTEQLKALAMQLQGAHQAALESEQEPAACEQESEQARSLCQRRSKPLQPQEDSQVQQLKGQVLSLTQEVEECRAELERLRQRRERENQEGATLVSMLRADVDLSQSERGALRDALRRLLGVFGETLKAAVALKSRIDERLGLFLDQAEAGQAPSAAPPLEEMWSDAALLELDRALPEGAEMSSVAEISSHVCESFFMSPESTLECEQPIRRVYQSLGMAVDGLLEMALDSSRQLEEARQIHSRFEKEFNHKNEETAQVLQKHQELLECLREQRAARAELALELHRAEGLLEGFKVEKADLQEALGRKEESEQQLVLELGSLGRQLEQAAQEKAALQEERSILRSQREAWAAEAETREAALKKEVESLTREQVEAREQAEKDRAALLSQVRLLELELEEQLSQHRGCARQAEEEAVALKQQLAALDKQLRNQRQFMDEQAAEREHEREEFQQEIQRLEGQLRQVARLRPLGPCDSQGRQCAQLDEEIELLQEKLREKSDGFNELVIKKELADRQVLIQEEEIKHLEETNANTKRQVAQLQEELEKQKKMVKKLQEEEAVKEQQRSDVILVPLPQSRTPEGRCPMPPRGSPREGAEVLSEALQRALLQHESQVLDLKEQLEKMKDDLVSKNEEILHLKLKLDVQSDPAATSTQGLDEESAGIKVEYSRSSEVEELKAIIENLQENQERLQKDKAEEIEQLHEVIEKLQSELSLMGPVVHELSDSQVGSLRNELLCSQAQGPGGQVLQAELEAARAAKEALGQLLADQARGHSEALEALQQRLQAAEEAAARQLAELGHSVALREAEVQGMASRIQELEALLKAREATLVQRDSEIGALNRSRAAHSAELEAVLLALARFRCALEQQPRAAPEEPPELQRLRVQCVRLSRQLQALSHRFLRCQAELGQQQACVDAQAVCDDWLEQGSGGPHGQGPQDDLQPAKVLVTLKDTGFHKPESAMSVLTVCQRQLEAELLLVTEGLCLSPEDVGRVPAGMQGKNKRLEDCQLQKFDLIAQVKQLQKKLNRLVHSMAFQDMDVGGSEPQQPSAAASPSENSSSESSCDGEAADASPPVAAFALPTTPWGLIGSTKGRHSLVRMEMPCFPTREPSEAQDEPLSSQTSDPSESCHAKEAEPEKDPLRVLDLSSWSSPEVLRKDATLDPQPSFPLTPCSGALSLPSVMASPQPGADSLLQADMSELHCYPGGSAAGPALQWAGALPAEQHHHHMESTAAEKDVEDFIATASNSQDTRRSSPLGLAGDCDGSEHSGSLGFGMMLSPELGRPEVPTAGSATPALVSRGSQQPPGVMQEKEVHPLHMKALLQMVCDESHQILALSESRGLPSTLSKGAPWASLDYFSSEGQGLLEGAPEKGEKESSDTHLDWRGRFLQAVQEALEREREKLKAELQSRPSGPDPVDYSFLFERLEKVVREQGDLQEKAQKHQRLQDRSSLLSEVQALRAQLRLTHLQNQEKLQQLCAALTSAEARGSQREHQLRRQVELLAYKVEQEKCIASDLQRTLSKEQETASDVRRLLALEQSAAQDLKSENARLLESLEEVQRESLQLRSLLDGKESDLKAALEELECERGKERVLQAQQEEQQLQHLQREGQSAKALEELKISLEKQHAQNNQLCIALKHERMAKDNLQQELQIEHSRCEALLAQERSQLSQLQESLEAERSRSRELSEALQHERVLTEQLSRSTQEKPMQHTLLRKLKEEKARVQELQAVLARVQQQALHTQQQLEAQAQEHRVQLQKQQERELQLQRQRDAHKMEQLQQVVRGLRVEEEEEAPQGDGPRPGSLESDLLQGQRQELERIRQQLLCAAGLLASFVSRTVDRTIHDWTVSNEKAVSSLVQTLQGLKSELSMPTSSQKKTAAELQVQLVDLLLQDNNALTSALSTAAREEAELRRVVSRLERTLKHHAQKGCVLGRSGRSAWKHDRTVPRCSDPGRPTLEASEEANISSVKMEKLYLHYLRAESFRKALIYQKKYLLLLIGGFQDSEQETLSMIAHLGVFPSKADKKGASSRPFTRFRTAVRVVIAVLRLRFLVKKWQEVDRKGVPPQGRAPRPGPRVPQQQLSPPETRLTPPTQDEPSGLARDTAQGSGPAAAAFPSWKERSAPSPNSRLERALAASQDSEHSLTEYIHHLEMIQQRLVGVQPDSTSKKSCRQKTKQ
ncbi:pericentrin isoform X12 [Marmota monax]|uniref:pericentrin isoform X12 n=1 Tax=Marmota monax TaxID=9995 RepID=UPI001EB02633|nr:pericentrin isoform X12 [Marmota monax]